MFDTVYVHDCDLFCSAKCAPSGAEQFPTSETDCPNHCAECGELIDQPLTTDGVAYVIEAIDQHNKNGRGCRDVLTQWSEVVRDYGLDPLQTEIIDTFENGEPSVDDRCDTLQALIDNGDARAEQYLSGLIDHVRDIDGDCEELRRLCLLELVREDDDTIGPDDIENTHGDAFGVNASYRDFGHGRVKVYEREYLVFTDDEANSAWDDELERYIDDCILPEVDEVAARYFDRKSWKRDARHDGRGHSLAAYDGDERDAREFVVFRTN